MARLPDRRPLLYYITDGSALPGGDPLPLIRQAIGAGLDLIQVRERSLETRPLLALVEAAVAPLEAGETVTRVLVNDRLDIALAAGAAGVHLPTHGLPIAEVRRRHPGLLLGASCHDLDELRRAEEGGADFAVFGPVFETASKKQFGAPLGVEELFRAVRAVRIPVLALGGITPANAPTCLDAGAAGLAAIFMFQTSGDLKKLVEQLRGLNR